jgi:hypothetical protein
LTFRTLLKILGEILGKPPNSANVRNALAPPTVREGKFVRARDEDDEMIVDSPPLLEFGDPEVDEPPTPTLVVAPESIEKAGDIPPIPTVRRSVGQRDAGGVIPSDPSRDEMMPRPQALAKPPETP